MGRKVGARVSGPITTASQLARARACPASVLLPQAPHIDTEPANRGNAVHHCADSISVCLRERGMDLHSAVAEALEHTEPEYRDLCAAVPWQEIPLHCKSEVGYAYNVVTGEARWLKMSGPRDYSTCTEDEIAGTADLVGVAGDLGYVGDIKTGWYDFGPPDKADQLLVGALAVTRLLGLSKCQVQWIRTRGGDVYKPTAVVDVFQLETYAAELRTWRERARQYRSVAPGFGAIEGEHCHFCPALPSCPEKRERSQALMKLPDEPMHSWPLPANSAAERYQQWRMTKTVADYMARYLHAEAKAEPIQLSNGMMFGPHEKRGNEKIDGPTAWAVLLRHVSIEKAMACVTPVVTKAGLKRGLDDKDLFKKVLAEIREAGGATRKTKTEIEEYE